MKRRFTEEQIIGFLREADAGLPIKELCRKHGFSEPSYVCVRRTRLDDGRVDQLAVVAGCQWCGSNSWTRLAGCVGSRSSTSFR